MDYFTKFEKYREYKKKKKRANFIHILPNKEKLQETFHIFPLSKHLFLHIGDHTLCTIFYHWLIFAPPKVMIWMFSTWLHAHYYCNCLLLHSGVLSVSPLVAGGSGLPVTSREKEFSETLREESVVFISREAVNILSWTWNTQYICIQSINDFLRMFGFLLGFLIFCWCLFYTLLTHLMI